MHKNMRIEITAIFGANNSQLSLRLPSSSFLSSCYLVDLSTFLLMLSTHTKTAPTIINILKYKYIRLICNGQVPVTTFAETKTTKPNCFCCSSNKKTLKPFHELVTANQRSNDQQNNSRKTECVSRERPNKYAHKKPGHFRNRKV